MQGNSNTLRVSVAGAVRAELARRGVPAARLIEHLGMSTATGYSRMSGASPFNIDELESTAQFLGIEFADLIASARLGHPARDAA